MGLQGFLVLIIIIAGVILLYGTQLQELITNATNAYQNGIVNNAVKPVPKQGQQVCTLDIGFHATLIGAFLNINQFVTIPNGAYKVSWIGCQGSVVANSLIPLPDLYIFNANTLDLTTGTIGTG
jgi:hypothetical protein